MVQLATGSPLAVLVAALLSWFVLHALGSAATRSRRVRPGEPTGDLAGDEPPAVVTVLQSRWSVTEDAAEATLLDLVARGYLEFRTPDADPLRTTVRIGAAPAPDVELTPYERQVLDRVRRVAGDRDVRLSALTFVDEAEADHWFRGFEAAVLADARRRGLVRNRLPTWLVASLAVAALIPAVAANALVAGLGGLSPAVAPAAGLLTLALLGAVAARRRPWCGTARGRRAAARWSALRSYLADDPTFAALPPSAVAGQGRRLAYGDALGITPVVGTIVDLGPVRRALVWSSFGGRWRQVQVRYPAPTARFGSAVPRLALGSAAAVVVGAAFLWASWYALPLAVGRVDVPARWVVPFRAACAASGSLAAVLGLYRSVRTAADLVAPRAFVGEVLRVAPVRRRSRRAERRAERRGLGEVTVHYLAVDDGTADRTTAWALPSEVTRGFGPGDAVQLTVRPWSRRVTRLGVASSRHALPARATTVLAPQADPIVAAADVVAAARRPDPAGDRAGERGHDVRARPPG